MPGLPNSKYGTLFSLILFLGIYNINILQGQELTGVSSVWDDSFSEWELFFYDHNTREETTGSMRIKWPLRGDRKEWIIQTPFQNATLQLKFDNPIHHWELRTDQNQIVELKSLWRNDFSKWRIYQGGAQYDYRAEYPNDLNYWFFENDTLGTVEIVTVYENDPRDWEFIDRSPNLNQAVKLAMMFIAVFYTTSAY